MLYAKGMEIDRIASPFIELLYDLDEIYRRILIPEDLCISKYLYYLRDAGPVFYVIIDQTSKIIDVVAEMKNGHYIKCKLVDNYTPEPENIGQNDYGYECGHEIFSHKIVQLSADLALKNDGKNKLFLNPYRGPLYSPEFDYSIYPLSREKNLHYAGKRPENTYFIVLSPTGQIIDVIAELIRGDFIKCARTTTASPDDIESDEDLRLGYLCGYEFFEINHMRQTAKLAKARKLKQLRQVYPKKYKDDSLEGFMYPLYPNGRFYGSAVRTSNGIRPCEASMRGIEAAHPETDNFICEYVNVEFENERLLEIVKFACKALGTQARKFPAKYNGPAFNVHGPYVTWPIKNGNSINGRKNPLPTLFYLITNYKFRVVMNSECMLAGVIAKYDENTFYKCRRSNDYSIPGGESSTPITETPMLK
ncbi:hypothetical protein EPUL_004399, partial [Erysiphe pulchra]